MKYYNLCQNLWKVLRASQPYEEKQHLYIYIYQIESNILIFTMKLTKENTQMEVCILHYVVICDLSKWNYQNKEKLGEFLNN